MPRLYRVKYLNTHGESFTVANGVPSDVADGHFRHIESAPVYEWMRIRIETMDGELVHELVRSPLPNV